MSGAVYKSGGEGMMTAPNPVPDAAPAPGRKAPALLLLIKGSVYALLVGALLFLSSGDLAWPMAWVFAAFCLISVFVNALVLDPALMAERAKAREGAKNWDKPIVAVIAMAPLVICLVAGLDRRVAGGPRFLPAWQLGALVPMIAGYLLTLWAMMSNRFFSAIVRIQKERGHSVATAGPYRFVRHPGYAGILVFYPGLPFLLGSSWALIPCGLLVPVLIVRTVLEDRALRAELAGYEEYARRVRYRLLPGLW